MFEQLTTDQVIELLVRFSIEAVLLSICVLLAWFKFGLRTIVSRLGRWQAKTVTAFLIILTTVQLVDRWQYHFPSRLSFYPAARFAMYQTGKSQGSVASYRFEGKFDNSWQEVNPTEELSAIGLPSLSTRFRIIARKLVSEDVEQNNWARQQIEIYCEAIKNLHIRRNELPPTSMRFISESWDPESMKRTDLESFEVQL